MFFAVLPPKPCSKGETIDCNPTIVEMSDQEITESVPVETVERGSTPPHDFEDNFSEIQRPDWVPDAKQKECYICSKEFTLLNRRHHCRACGKICCGNCSSHKIDLTSLGYIGLQRVCDACKKSMKKKKHKKRDRRNTTSAPILQGEMQLTDILGRPLRRFHFSLTNAAFRWYKNPEEQVAAYYILLEDILAVQTPTELEFLITSFPWRGPENKQYREKMIIRVKCESRDQRDKWKHEIESRIPFLNNQNRRKILVLINPYGGKKIAHVIWKEVESIFQLVPSIELSVNFTEYSGHAYEIANKLVLDRFDSIVTVSGDGLLHEVINGLMHREDWQEAMKIPVGVIPGGSGNALAAEMGNINPVSAAVAIIKGKTRPFDLLKVSQAGQKDEYNIVSVNWGLVSDVDFESEKYRFMGSVRFTIGALVRITNLRYYSGRIEYVPSTLPENQFCTRTEDCKVCKLGRQLYSEEHGKETEPDKWKVLEGEFVTIIGSNISKLSHDARMAPYAHLSDGAIDLLVVERCTRSSLLNLFADLETGEFVNSPVFNSTDSIKHLKVKEYRLQSGTDISIFGFDGERARSNEPIHVASVCGVATIIG